MKKVIYIGITVLALGMISCSKQDVSPNSSTETVVPVWKSLDTDVDDPGTNDPGTVDPGGDGSITDPNENEEIAEIGN